MFSFWHCFFLKTLNIIRTYLNNNLFIFILQLSYCIMKLSRVHDTCSKLEVVDPEEWTKHMTTFGRDDASRSPRRRDQSNGELKARTTLMSYWKLGDDSVGDVSLISFFFPYLVGWLTLLWRIVERSGPGCHDALRYVGDIGGSFAYGNLWGDLRCRNEEAPWQRRKVGNYRFWKKIWMCI